MIHNRIPFCLFFFLLALYSCGEENSTTIQNVKANAAKNKSEFDNGVRSHAETTSAHIIINDVAFEMYSMDGRFCGLLERGNNPDTIVPFANYYMHLEVEDINLDGFDDLRVYENEGAVNGCSNYLYDIDIESFNKLENCYLDIEKITGTDYYYSYEAISCSDFNWESYLCKINNSEVENYGLIEGMGCGTDVPDNDATIEIYKVRDANYSYHELVETLSYSKYIPRNSEKWNFIEEYWKKNYKNFYRR